MTSEVCGMESNNKLSRMVVKIQRAPQWMQSWLLSQLFGRAVKFAGTAGIRIRQLTFQQAVLQQANFRKVQNHIGSVHAAAMALLGESASGFLVGMHVPDDRLPLLKSMKLDYVKRASGQLTATVSLTAEQIQHIRSSAKGEVTLRVQISDQVGVEPVVAEYVWAWVPKNRAVVNTSTE
jgi:acyl-coenzyme A thioesterase PaaI-like protein